MEMHPPIPRSTGPRDAFERIYRQHAGFVVANLRRLGVHGAQLEDAAQDVFVAVHRRRSSFEGRAAMRTWIYAILRNVASRYRRTDARTRRKLEKLTVTAVPVFADLEREVQDRQAAEILGAFLDTLDRKQREAFILGEIERMTRQELGAALGVNPNTAYSRLRLARARFLSTFGDPDSRDALLERWREPPANADRERRIWALLVPQLGPSVAFPTLAISTVSVGWTLVTGAAVMGVLGVGSAAIGAVEAPEARPSTRAAPAVAVQRDLTEATGETLDEPESLPQLPDAAFELPAETGRGLSATDASRPPAPSLRRSRSPRSNVPGSCPPSSLASEVSRLTEATRAFARGDHAASLKMVRAHRRGFPDSPFLVDLAVLEIDSLCGLERADEARRLATRFLRSHGREAQAARVRASCGG